jgi:outer membrane protein assembly factor BamD (BamD/ComL family)
LFGVLVAVSSALAQPKTWQYTGGGKWEEAQTRPAGPATPLRNPRLDLAEELLEAGHNHQAHKILLTWIKANPKAADRDRATYLLAREYYQNGDRVWCFYECDELLDNYPDSRLYFPALELQYRVADEYLAGKKKKLLGLPIIDMEDEAIEMLYRIQARSPGSAIAERALLRTADHYYRTAQFDLAADAYGAYARTYPRSNQVPRVKLAQAFSNFAQFRGIRYDATPLIDARAEFLDVQARYPRLAADENIPQFLARIDTELSAKMYETADYYRRTNQPRSAVFLYRSLIKAYPQSRDAQAAERELQKMPKWAVNEPQPPLPAAAELPAPTTRPGGP